MRLKAFITSLNVDKKYPQFSKCGYTKDIFMRDIHKYGNVDYSELELSDVIFVFVTFLGNDYTFDEKTAELISKANKPIVIFDYTEYGPHNGEIRVGEYNLFGYKIEFSDLTTGNSDKMHKFLFDNQTLIKCYFKRELGTHVDISKVPFNVYPLEFICDDYNISTNVDTKDEYYTRRCIYNFVWGFSNYSRPQLHGAILVNMQKFACRFALSYKQATTILKDSDEKFMFVVNHDWYERVDLNPINSKSMMIVDLYGCGQKCFRNVESTKNSLSVKQDPNQLKYAYEWKDGINCISLPVNNDMSLDLNKSIEVLLEYRHDKQHLLYDMYLNSVEMNKLYSPNNYIPNHLIKNIRNNI
jgi:hypothetical protein